MDISTEIVNSNIHRKSPFLTMLQTVLNKAWLLFECLALSEEDQLKAGINLGGEGRGR
jgi:hypothetical protein